MAKVRASRNQPLSKGIGRYSRSAMYRKRALYKRKKTGVTKDVKEQAKTMVKEIGGEKNGGSRTVPVQREVSVKPLLMEDQFWVLDYSHQLMLVVFFLASLLPN